MESILEYIMSHYILFLGGTITILLAIIGYYADKTNFGQGKIKDSISEEKQELEQNKFETLQDAVQNMQDQDLRLQSIVENPQQQIQLQDTIENSQDTNAQLLDVKESNITNQSLENNLDDNNYVLDIQSENIITPQDNQEIMDKKSNFEENFKEFDKEFNEILPKKETIDDQILDEIENLSFDKTQKIDLTDISNLDDVELPKIKNLKPETDDIWKF